MPTVNFDTMDIDIQVKSIKRRFKTPSLFHKSENKRKSIILESMRRKPYKKRAIQRARDLKYTDDGRGEEAEVDMVHENFNSILSSRVSKPFRLIHTYKDWVVTSKQLPDGRWTMDAKLDDQTRIAVRGVEYPAIHKHEYDIVMLHEVNGRRVHYWADPTLVRTCPESYFHFGNTGTYEKI